MSTPRPRLRLWAILPLLSILVLGASALALVLHLNRPTGSASTCELEIEPGMNVRRIGQLLERRHIVRSAALFAACVRLRGLERQLEAGVYQLDGSQSTMAVIESLRRAPVRLRRITIPEGLTRHEIAALLAAQGLVDSTRFLQLTTNITFIRSLGLRTTNLEGFLFPETYFLDAHPAPADIIRRMVQEFFSVFTDSLRARLPHVGLTLEQAVTLASIVEREAMVATERPLIAGVFLRRLQLGRRLESCATVEFALGRHKRRLSNADLRVDSPYNTYRHRGLPPGPISNPGEAALRAVLFPETTEYLYFVARGDGTHIFSRTNREHIRAKRALRRRR